MSKPTKDDANLMIQLLRWGAEEGVQDAMNWVWSDEFVSDYDDFIASKYCVMQHAYAYARNFVMQFVSNIN